MREFRSIFNGLEVFEERKECVDVFESTDVYFESFEMF